WLSVANGTNNDVSGQLTWFKPAQAGTQVYPSGFTIQSDTVGSTYFGDFFASTNGTPILNFTNGGILVLEGAALTQNITNHIQISGKNKVTNLDTNALSLSFTTAGLFNGSVVDPATRVSIPFHGAVLQKENSGLGFFLLSNQSGRVLLLPQ